MNTFLKYFFLVLIGLLGIQQPSFADELEDIKRLYVFGDSLSDSGNDYIYTKRLFQPQIDIGVLPPDFPAVPPSVSPHKTYFKGRFSNGPVAVEYLCKFLEICDKPSMKPSEGVVNFVGEKNLDFGYGGSESGVSNLTPGGFPVPGALGQAHSFIQAYQAVCKQIPCNALYVVWTGANDYLLEPVTPPISQVVGNIIQSMEALYSAGARKFLVPNLPDLGSVPIMQIFPVGSSAGFTYLTEAHNSALDQALIAFRQAHGSATVVGVDIFNLFVPLTTSLNPGIGPGGDCLLGNIYLCGDVDNFDSLNYLYWDIEHPTTAVHRLIAKEMLERLKHD